MHHVLQCEQRRHAATHRQILTILVFSQTHLAIGQDQGQWRSKHEKVGHLKVELSNFRLASGASPSRSRTRGIAHMSPTVFSFHPQMALILTGLCTPLTVTQIRVTDGLRIVIQFVELVWFIWAICVAVSVRLMQTAVATIATVVSADQVRIVFAEGIVG